MLSKNAVKPYMIQIPSKKGCILFLLICSSVANYNRINEWPLQFLRTGYYSRSYGYLGERTTYGNWWSDMAGLATLGHYLDTWIGNVHAQLNYFRGLGFALRCGVGKKNVENACF